MDLTPVLPDPARLTIHSVILTPQQITLVLASTPTSAACPLCGQPFSRMHSRYVRQVADLPWLGIGVRILLHVRRSFVSALRTFAERTHVITAKSAMREDRDWISGAHRAIGRG